MTFDVSDLEEPLKPHKERNNEEFRIHVSIIDHVTGRKTGSKAFNTFICHVFQGRDAKDGFFLKMLGVVPGVGDLLVLWRAKCACGIDKVGIGFMEVKKPGGVQTTPQRRFQGLCHWLGVHYGIVTSVKTAHDMLVRWGCPERHASVKEADVRTDSQKKKDAFEFFKPK